MKWVAVVGFEFGVVEVSNDNRRLPPIGLRGTVIGAIEGVRGLRRVTGDFGVVVSEGPGAGGEHEEERERVTPGESAGAGEGHGAYDAEPQQAFQRAARERTIRPRAQMTALDAVLWRAMAPNTSAPPIAATAPPKELFIQNP